MAGIQLGRQPATGRRAAAADADLAAMAKALGHPARIRLLRLLAGRTGCCHGSLADELPLAASTVSEHLRILRGAGLVQGDVEGPRTSYCLNRARLHEAVTLLSAIAELRPPGESVC